MDPPITLPSTTVIGQYVKSHRLFWEDAIDPLLFVYIVLILWYIYVIYVINNSHNERFKSQYFKFFIVTGIADVVNAIVTEYIRFSQRVGLGPAMGWLLQITTAITGSNFAIHLLGNILMSFFQFTAVWIPLYHPKIWTKKNTLFMKLIIILVPLCVYSHLLFTEFQFEIENERYIYKQRKDPITKTRILDCALMVCQAVFSMTFAIAAVVGIRIKTGQNFKKSIPEKGLIFVEIVNVIFGSMETLYGIFSLYNISDDNIFIKFIVNEFVSYFFLMLVLNSITLPILSRSVRLEILSRWNPCRSSTVAIVSRSNMSQNWANHVNS